MRLGLTLLAAASLLAGAASAKAVPSCDVQALRALPIADLAITEAVLIAASNGQPAHCRVSGTVVTRGDGVGEGLARFSLQLPETWGRRLLFLGVGGNAGTLQPSANAVDRASALLKGYAVIVTDTGHVGDGTTAAWVRKPDGSLDQPKVTDYLFRAVHSVTVAGKAFAQAYYAVPIQRTYFDGCSTGGRMALAAAIHYPNDFSGIIAGDPSLDYNLNIARMAMQRIVLAKPARYIPPETVVALDKRIVGLCDAADGAKDGLVQNPAACAVKPEDLACRPGERAACLKPDQLFLFRAYLSPLRDRQGRAIYPGWPIAHLVGSNAVSFYAFGSRAPDIANAERPWGEDDTKAPRGFRLGREALTDWLGYGRDARIQEADIDPSDKSAGPELMARTRTVMGEGETREAAGLAPYLHGGGKLILYHGASDPSIPAARTIALYEELAASYGAEQLLNGARLFVVPGMHHCSGGPGPDRFDTLTALEAWVEASQAPVSIRATTAPGAETAHHIPLCPYPQQARFIGGADLADEKSWRCEARR